MRFSNSNAKKNVYRYKIIQGASQKKYHCNGQAKGYIFGKVGK